jgi:hypothetical protein
MSNKRMADPESFEEEIAPLSAARPTALALDELLRIAADPTLTEDLALSLLKRADLDPQVLEQFAKNASVLKSRKVRMALASHPHTPRHVSVPLARQFYTFDLMKLALAPGAPADVKVAVDDILIARLETVTIGERLTLARRASGRVAAALLLQGKKANSPLIEAKSADDTTQSPQTRVMQTALDNPRLTETLIISSVLRADASAALVHAVARHAKWSPRKEIRMALLRTEHVSLARALEFGSEIPTPLLRELLDSSLLPSRIKEQLLRESEKP